ncbi:MAG: hypothetical protein R2861_05270 [Desulfobacterales bacterium]
MDDTFDISYIRGRNQLAVNAVGQENLSGASTESRTCSSTWLHVHFHHNGKFHIFAGVFHYFARKGPQGLA